MILDSFDRAGGHPPGIGNPAMFSIGYGHKSRNIVDLHD
jgi:hypothetical protein